MNRRSFLQAAAATGAFAFLQPPLRAARPAGEKVILSAPLTHSDWMLKPGIAWGEPGVRHMLKACQAAGWTRVYWRVCDAGQATYASKLMRAAQHPDPDNIFNPQTDADREVVRRLLPNLTAAQGKGYLEKFATMDYGAFDSLASAIKIGHELGLEVHAWVTINEDDHGWGWPSEFSKAHPQFRWVRRDGRAYRSQLSFAFEEVRRYKLGILAELLAYPIDGLFLDWIRTGDIRDNPQNDPAGIADFGYETPNLETFKKLTGLAPQEVAAADERWARVRAEPQTVFMRAARERCRARAPRLPLAVMVGHPWHYRGTVERIAGNLQGLMLDVAAWAREGLVDSVVAAGYYRDGGTSEKAWRALTEETGGKADVWSYAWVPQDVATFEREFELSGSLGARQILFWEADYIDDRTNAAELKRAMFARSDKSKK
jgi:uncharacterized lipoprotein YddW (UPF0748 family)